MGQSKRRSPKNIVWDFAWWWFSFVDETEPDVNSRQFKAMLGKAKNLKGEGYDLEKVKRTIRTMKLQGIRIDSPYAVKFRSPDFKTVWYEYAQAELPPMYDGLAMALIAEGSMPIKAS